MQQHVNKVKISCNTTKCKFFTNWDLQYHEKILYQEMRVNFLHTLLWKRYIYVSNSYDSKLLLCVVQTKIIKMYRQDILCIKLGYNQLDIEYPFFFKIKQRPISFQKRTPHKTLLWYFCSFKCNSSNAFITSKQNVIYYVKTTFTSRQLNIREFHIWQTNALKLLNSQRFHII